MNSSTSCPLVLPVMILLKFNFQCGVLFITDDDDKDDDDDT